MDNLSKEEIVLKNMNKAAKSLLHFDIQDSWYGNADERRKSLDVEINDLKSKESIYDRVYTILWIAGRHPTYNNRNRFQCHGGANRSLFDIKRIYEYYFGEVSVFSIMRVLYKLAVVDKKISTFSCWTTRKLVFWTDRMNTYGRECKITPKREVGVPVKDWENIGLEVNNG